MRSTWVGYGEMAVVAALAVAVVALSRVTKVAADAPVAYLSAPGVTAGVSGNSIEIVTIRCR